jgi:site-specific recombinase XerD
MWHELMARPPEPEQPALPTGPDVLAIEILDAFLDWCQKHRAERTYQWYRENIQKLVSALPRRLRAADLKPYHLTVALDNYPHWANDTKHDFLSAVKRAFSWALEQGLIHGNPVTHLRKPSREAREVVVSAALGG